MASKWPQDAQKGRPARPQRAKRYKPHFVWAVRLCYESWRTENPLRCFWPPRSSFGTLSLLAMREQSWRTFSASCWLYRKGGGLRMKEENVLRVHRRTQCRVPCPPTSVVVRLEAVNREADVFWSRERITHSWSMMPLLVMGRACSLNEDIRGQVTFLSRPRSLLLEPYRRSLWLLPTHVWSHQVPSCERCNFWSASRAQHS